MPVKKGKGCVADVMREWKAGKLHSGKDGAVVKNQEQAVAIALSMCGKSKPRGASYEELASKLLAEIKAMPQRSADEFDMGERPVGNRAASPFLPGRMGLHAPKFSDGCGCGPKCGCKSCQSKYGEGGAIRMQPALGYPTPQFEEDEEGGERDETIEMVIARLRVIMGRTNEIKQAIERAMAERGECELERWMIDKLTLAADYVSAVAGEVHYGGALEGDENEEEEDEEYGGVYGGGAGGYPGYAEGKG